MKSTCVNPFLGRIFNRWDSMVGMLCSFINVSTSNDTGMPTWFNACTVVTGGNFRISGKVRLLFDPNKSFVFLSSQ